MLKTAAELAAETLLKGSVSGTRQCAQSAPHLFFCSLDLLQFDILLGEEYLAKRNRRNKDRKEGGKDESVKGIVRDNAFDPGVRGDDEGELAAAKNEGGNQEGLGKELRRSEEEVGRGGGGRESVNAILTRSSRPTSPHLLTILNPSFKNSILFIGKAKIPDPILVKMMMT